MERENRALAVWPRAGHGPSFRAWAREKRDLAAFSVRPPAFPDGAPRALSAKGVLVVPGFLTGDWATARLRQFLASLGYAAEGWGQGTNWGPRRQVMAMLEGRLAAQAERTGGPVTVIGQSLGGLFARELAKRAPDRVSMVITLCTPVQFPVATPLAPAFWALKPLMDRSFLSLAAEAFQPPPAPLLAVYSKRDGIVDWRACLIEPRAGDMLAEHDAGHTTVASTPSVQLQIAMTLRAQALTAKEKAGDRSPA
jgi:pimeloyl-ACP methyl ester carboxylesterase